MKRRLQKTNKEQYILTIPKTLVEILAWQNKDEIEFKLETNSILIKKSEKKSKITRNLQKTNKEQYLLTIPKTLIEILNWANKENIQFVLEKNMIRLRNKK